MSVRGLSCSYCDQPAVMGNGSRGRPLRACGKTACRDRLMRESGGHGLDLRRITEPAPVAVIRSGPEVRRLLERDRGDHGRDPN